MATPGLRTRQAHRELAGSLVRLARAQRGWSQRELAEAARVPTSTVGVIETGGRQPSLPVLLRLLAAADLDLRLHLAPYDDHDDALDLVDLHRSRDGRAGVQGRAITDRAVIRTGRPAGTTPLRPAVVPSDEP